VYLHLLARVTTQLWNGTVLYSAHCTLYNASCWRTCCTKM